MDANAVVRYVLNYMINQLYQLKSHHLLDESDQEEAILASQVKNVLTDYLVVPTQQPLYDQYQQQLLLQAPTCVQYHV